MNFIFSEVSVLALISTSRPYSLIAVFNQLEPTQRLTVTCAMFFFSLPFWTSSAYPTFLHFQHTALPQVKKIKRKKSLMTHFYP